MRTEAWHRQITRESFGIETRICLNDPIKQNTGKKRALLGHVEHLQAAALHVCRQAHLPFQGMAQRQVFTAELCLRGDGRDPGCTPRRPRKIYALDQKAARWQVGITEKEIKFALWYDCNNKGQRAAGYHHLFGRCGSTGRVSKAKYGSYHRFIAFTRHAEPPFLWGRNGRRARAAHTGACENGCGLTIIWGDLGRGAPSGLAQRS